MFRKKRPKFNWSAREKVLQAWLLDQEQRSERAEAIPKERRLRATAALWGWLPLALIIFWITYILVQHVAFAHESAATAYHISAFGTDDVPVVANIAEGKIIVLVPRGVDVVRIGKVRDANACSSSDRSNKPRPIPRSIKDVTNGKWTEIAPDKDLKFTVQSVYGTERWVALITCQLDWKPQHTSFATYRVQIANADDTDLTRTNSRLPHGSKRLKIFVESDLDEHRFSGLSVASIMPDERTLSKDDVVDLSWTPVGAAQLRDIYLIVIGALIALGAAIVVEGLRARVEIAIETSDVHFLKRRSP